ncbi:hypothetical protein [Salinivibrio sp. PR932]|uniref:hypothetical protein n=1 Tax=Salinivibrio sp. PR932 TaxID=1909492 RepID=UPI001F52AC8D|nr:hypothetical protein [Salinivibrio sp. PR932]
MKQVIFILCTLMSGVVMSEGLFLSSYNKVSDRYAILDEFDQSGVLYLTKPETQQPERDAVAYIQYAPVSEDAWKQKMRAGEPPQLHEGLASEVAVIPKTAEQDFSFLWSADGNSVALLYKNAPIAFVSQNEKYGFSKAVVSDSPIVSMWDTDKFNELFE